MPARKHADDPTLGDGMVLVDLTDDEIDEKQDELVKLLGKQEKLEAEKREVSSDLRGQLRKIKERVSVLTQAITTKRIRKDAQQALFEQSESQAKKKGANGAGNGNGRAATV